VTPRGRAARSKGIRFERAVAEALGTVTIRSLRPGVHDDGGDVVVPGFHVECRDRARWAVNQWWHTTEVVADIHQDVPLLVIKRPMRPVLDALVVARMGDVIVHRERES
jgi:hypothetical protein